MNASYQVEKREQQINHEEIFAQIKNNLLKKKEFDSKVMENDRFLETSIEDLTLNPSIDNSKESNKFTLVQNEKKQNHDKQLLKDYEENFSKLKDILGITEEEVMNKNTDLILNNNEIYQ